MSYYWSPCPTVGSGVAKLGVARGVACIIRVWGRAKARDVHVTVCHPNAAGPGSRSVDGDL